MTQTYIHTPVLLEQALLCLSPEGEGYPNGGFMIDSTLGEGGHSYAFLNRFPALRIMGLDADESIQKRARERLAVFGDRMSFFKGWFTDFYADYPSSLPRPDIILFDLGISVFHYECSGRGFSFRSDEPLDMRLNPTEGKTAADLVNTLHVDALADIFFRFADERYSRRIAKAIEVQRRLSTFTSAKQLAECIWNAVPASYRFASTHPATKSFQALRIAVNKELERLNEVLDKAFGILNSAGKMGVISFHSLEDKIVKNYFKSCAKSCVCPPRQPVCTCSGKAKAKLITRKPLTADERETAANLASRSAKMRVLQKL